MNFNILYVFLRILLGVITCIVGISLKLGFLALCIFLIIKIVSFFFSYFG